MVLYGVCTTDYSSINIYKVIRESSKTYTIYLPNSSKAVPISVVRKETMSTATERFFFDKVDAVKFLCTNFN